MTGKKYGELEAWAAQKELGAEWSLATMNCTMIWGPPSTLFPVFLHQVKS